MADSKVVYCIVDRPDGRSYWTRIGTASANKDGSIVVHLDAFPLSGNLQIRDVPKETRDSDDPIICLKCGSSKP